MKECKECGCKYTPPDYKWDYSECPNCDRYFEEQDEMDAYEWVME